MREQRVVGESVSISVITTTVSVGGLDMLFESLRTQILPPSYEVILVDEFYQERKAHGLDNFPWTMDEILKRFNLKHIAPRKKQNFIDHSCGWNSGAAVADGVLVCFLNDFTWLYPEYLRDHWEVYKTVSGYSMTGYCDRYPWPKLRPDQDISNTWWTAFEEMFTPDVAERYFAATEPVYRERKGWFKGEFVRNTDYRRIPGNLFYASLNESIPMAVLKELNGWDERMDGGYGSNDVDLGVRAEIAGWRFLLKPTVNKRLGVYKMPRPVKSVPKAILRGTEDNFAMYRNRILEIMDRREPLATPKGWGIE